MKFGQLMNIKHETFFLKIHAKNVVETLARLFSEISKLGRSQDQYSKVLNSLYLLYAKLRAIRIY